MQQYMSMLLDGLCYDHVIEMFMVYRLLGVHCTLGTYLHYYRPTCIDDDGGNNDWCVEGGGLEPFDKML